MSKIRDLFNRKMWVGLFWVFAASLAVNALCSMLLIKGVVPESSVNACVYVAWGIGGLVGAVVAVTGEQRRMIRGGVLAGVSFGLTWLLGFLIFGSVNFGSYAWGVLASIYGGCIVGSFVNGGRKNKLRRTSGKRKKYRRKNRMN